MYLSCKCYSFITVFRPCLYTDQEIEDLLKIGENVFTEQRFYHGRTATFQIVRGRRQSTRKIRVRQTWRTRNGFNLLKISWRRFSFAFAVTDLVQSSIFDIKEG